VRTKLINLMKNTSVKIGTIIKDKKGLIS